MLSQVSAEDAGAPDVELEALACCLDRLSERFMHTLLAGRTSHGVDRGKCAADHHAARRQLQADNRMGAFPRVGLGAGAIGGGNGSRACASTGASTAAASVWPSATGVGSVGMGLR